MAKVDKCDNKIWRLDELESHIENAVRQLLLNPASFETLLKEHEKTQKEKSKPFDEAEIIRDKIAEHEKQISKLMDLFQADNIPVEVLTTRIDKIYREKVALSEQLEKIAPQVPQKDFDAASVIEMLTGLSNVWESANQQEKRLVLETLIDRITLDGNIVNIEWSFLQN
jgi:site-specific DNA recombinase